VIEILRHEFHKSFQKVYGYLPNIYEFEGVFVGDETYNRAYAIWKASRANALDDAIKICVENSWSGFKNSWLNKEKSSDKKERSSQTFTDKYWHLMSDEEKEMSKNQNLKQLE